MSNLDQNIEQVDATIAIRIREGAWNVLATFPAEVRAGYSVPVVGEEDVIIAGAKIRHDVTITSIIDGLILAIQNQASEWADNSAGRQKSKPGKAAARKEIADWLASRVEGISKRVEDEK